MGQVLISARASKRLGNGVRLSVRSRKPWTRRYPKRRFPNGRRWLSNSKVITRNQIHSKNPSQVSFIFCLCISHLIKNCSPLSRRSEAQVSSRRERRQESPRLCRTPQDVSIKFFMHGVGYRGETVSRNFPTTRPTLTKFTDASCGRNITRGHQIASISSNRFVTSAPHSRD